MPKNWGLETGDLLLFDGGNKTSKIIKIFTNGVYSHVGMVWRCPVTKKLFVWENGKPPKSSYPIIAVKDSDHAGAHLIPLKKRFKMYSGTIFVKRLMKNKINTEEFDNRYLEFIKKNIGRPYRTDFIACWNQVTGMSLMHLPFIDQNKDDSLEWWCGELVLYTYKYLGVITDVYGRFHTILPSEFERIQDHGRVEISKDYTFMELECLIY
jgi:hypothetical protein